MLQYFKKNAHENIKKQKQNTLKSSILLGPFFFSIANWPKISPNLIFCSIKWLPARLLYTDFVYSCLCILLKS